LGTDLASANSLQLLWSESGTPLKFSLVQQLRQLSRVLLTQG
jgi:hypothetical protein